MHVKIIARHGNVARELLETFLFLFFVSKIFLRTKSIPLNEESRFSLNYISDTCDANVHAVNAVIIPAPHSGETGNRSLD